MNKPLPPIAYEDLEPSPWMPSSGAIGESALDFNSDENGPERLRRITGIQDWQIANTLVNQLIEAHPDTPPKDRSRTRGSLAKQYGDVAALLAEMKPQGGLDSLAATQAVACHTMAMVAMRQAGCANPDLGGLSDRFLGHAERWMRLSIQSMDSLARIRNGGRQVVRVERVEITGDGSQVAIGDIRTGGGGGEG